jgi:S-adenosylmethionine-diacylgycerolhomoserine-N-methlytransferase
MATSAAGHGELMDSIYRSQRHIYDLTRKYFLFGRDTLIENLDCPPGAAVLEIGCGTGRNLAQIDRRWPGARLHGLDISSEMLKSASARLGDTATLLAGDATLFDGNLFGRRFDRVVLSFALSMIPDWQAALARGIDALAPGGSLHVVDFGGLSGLPAPLRALLRMWLAHFHVAPRLDLADRAAMLAATLGMTTTTRRGAFGYFQLVKITAPR